MLIFVILLWGIASLMACWSFSLSVRWVSEAIARRRKRFIAQRSNRSFWLGLALMFVCLGVASIAGYMAAYMDGLYSGSYDRIITPVAMAGGTVGLFGAMMLIWAIIGDRARGRVRCPKCWYDMSGAEGLQCPECGRTAKNEKQFNRSRRPKWAFIVAIGFLGISMYGISVSKRVFETDRLAVVPSWFLMAGWDWLPEDWILEENSSYETTLQNRLSERGGNLNWVSESRTRRFGKKLCRPLLDSHAARWDHKRLTLLAEIDQLLMFASSANGENDIWLGTPIDANALLLFATEEMLDAMLSDSYSHSDKLVLSASTVSETPFDFAARWVRKREEQAGTIDLEQDIRIIIEEETDVLLSVLDPLRSRLLNEEFGLALISNDKEIARISYDLAIQLNLFEDHLETYLSTNDDPKLISPWRRLNRAVAFSNYYSDESISRVLKKLTGLMTSNDPVNIALATRSLRIFQFVRLLDDTTKNEEYTLLIDLVKQYALHDERIINYGPIDKESLHALAVHVLITHDTTGELAYPLLRDLLLNTGDAPRLRPWRFSSSDRANNLDPKIWLDNFGDLADSPTRSVREWVISNMITRTGTPQDDALNQIALSFIANTEEEEDIRYLAIEALFRRDAADLIPNDNEP